MDTLRSSTVFVNSPIVVRNTVLRFRVGGCLLTSGLIGNLVVKTFQDVLLVFCEVRLCKP